MPCPYPMVETTDAAAVSSAVRSHHAVVGTFSRTFSNRSSALSCRKASFSDRSAATSAFSTCSSSTSPPTRRRIATSDSVSTCSMDGSGFLPLERKNHDLPAGGIGHDSRRIQGQCLCTGNSGPVLISSKMPSAPLLLLRVRITDRGMRFAGMVVQQLVKDTGRQGYEVETAGDCCAA